MTAPSSNPVFKADHWQVCAALVADCYAYAGIRLKPGLRDLGVAGAGGLDTWVAQSALNAVRLTRAA